MAGVARVQATMSILGLNGLDGPFTILGAQSVQKWTGKRHMQLATGTTDQALIDFGTGGITTANGFMLVADQNISVKFGTTGGNVAIALTAFFPIVMQGISLTLISLSNSSGNTANVEYYLNGV